MRESSINRSWFDGVVSEALPEIWATRQDIVLR